MPRPQCKLASSLVPSRHEAPQMFFTRGASQNIKQEPRPPARQNSLIISVATVTVTPGQQAFSDFQEQRE